MQPPQDQQPADYSGYMPPMTGGDQWVQRPLPNQPYQQIDVQGMPGQVPPPAPVYQAPEQAPPAYACPPQAEASEEAQQMYQTPPQAGAPRNGFQTPAYAPPATGMPRARKKTSKSIYVALILLAVGVAAFFILPRLMQQRRNAAYGYVRSGSMSARYTGDAVIVRSEKVYTQDSVSQIDFVAEEGEAVRRGSIVATIYTAGFSAKEWDTLQHYRDQIKAYHKVLISGAGSDTQLLAKMTNVRTKAMEVQQLVHGAQGNISRQEILLAKAMQDQQIYMKQKYPDDQKLSRLYDDENGQLQRISTWTKQFAAAADGLVSFYTDGYENALNMLTYTDFSPAQVRSMYNGQIPAGDETVSRNTVDVYRMVQLEPWAVLMLCNEKDWTPVDGRSYKLLIESFDNIEVDATVESFTRSGGELLVRLLINNTAALQNVLYMRTCQVQLGESVNTLMVPSRAIFVQNGRKGVVLATEGGEYWTGVETVSDDGTNAYVIPDNAGVLYDGVPVRLF
ncbi:MAG: hypothetical protein K5919_10180 [Clostridiales bacterium]|nr:hypothetical protein [Clostridiales bacterium]